MVSSNLRRCKKMSLFTYLTFLAFVNSYASRIVSVVMNLMPHDKSIGIISSEIFELRKELSLISMVDEFAKHARLQRKINKLQDDKKNLIADNAAKVASLRQTALYLTYGITSIMILVLIFLYNGETIAQLPPELLWPVPNIFNWFSDTSGCISLLSWVVISSSATKILAKYY